MLPKHQTRSVKLKNVFCSWGRKFSHYQKTHKIFLLKWHSYFVVQKHFIFDYFKACIFLKLVSLRRLTNELFLTSSLRYCILCMKSLFFTKINHLSQYCVDPKVFQVPFRPEFIVYDAKVRFLESMIFQLWLFLFNTWYWTSITAS